MKTILAGINTEKFFSIEYTTNDERTETYLVRSGVRNWKDNNGQHTVNGTGYATPEGMVRLYSANRKGYRMFQLSKIRKAKQGKIVNHVH